MYMYMQYVVYIFTRVHAIVVVDMWAFVMGCGFRTMTRDGWLGIIITVDHYVYVCQHLYMYIELECTCMCV